MSLALKEKLKWLDPFTYVDEFLLPVINPKKNETINSIVYIVSAFIFAFAAYSILGFIFNTSSPIVVVVSGSMEPVMHRGDIVFVSGAKPEQINAPEVKLEMETLKGVPLNEIARVAFIESNGLLEAKQIDFFDGQKIQLSKSNDIMVYNSLYRRKPIIHRVMAKISVKDGTYYLTKGDNKQTNYFIDQDCGEISNGIPQRPCIDLYPANQSQLNGKTVFAIPLIGYVKLLLVDDVLAILSGCKDCILP